MIIYHGLCFKHKLKISAILIILQPFHIQGPLDQFTHSMEPNLRQLGLPTSLQKGMTKISKKIRLLRFFIYWSTSCDLRQWKGGGRLINSMLWEETNTMHLNNYKEHEMCIFLSCYRRSCSPKWPWSLQKGRCSHTGTSQDTGRWMHINPCFPWWRNLSGIDL